MTRPNFQFSIFNCQFSIVPSSAARSLALALILVFSLGTLRAAEKRPDGLLRVSFTPRGMRSNAPARVQATFTWPGPRILEGRLELIFRASGRLLGTYRSFDLVLSGGQQSFDLVLPGLAVDANPSQVDVQARFLTGSRTLELEPAVWAVPHARQRACTIGVSSPPHEADPAYGKLLTSLRLDALQPKRAGAEGAAPIFSPVAATPVRVAPDDFPTEPLGYCSYDLLFLAGQGFSLLREGQLAAIARWVRAGGSVCVVPSLSLDARHVRFLNDLAGSPKTAFRTDRQGMLLTMAPPMPDQKAFRLPLSLDDDAFSVLLSQTGLGRTAVVLKPPPTAADLTTPAWRDTVSFLWRLRKSHCQAVADTGRWGGLFEFYDPYSTTDLWDPTERAGPRRVPAYPVPVCDLRAVTEGLIPPEVRIIPFSLVALILVLFVVAIGPLDYFVLGLLRRRKYTWITFPLIAIAFTCFTVKLSDYYMGKRDQRRSLVFIDVDREGRALRQQRFELVFSASEGTRRFELKNALFEPIGRTGLRDSGMAKGRFRGNPPAKAPPDSERDLAPPTRPEPVAFEGRIPSRYAALQSLYQSTAQLNRTLSLEPPDSMPKIAWDAVTLDDLADGLAKAQSKLLPRNEPSTSVYVLHGAAGLAACGPSAAPRFLVSGGWDERGILQVATAHPERGLFALVSQISPTGAPNFEDLAILDATDESQAVLAVVQVAEETITVYRCLYTAAPSRRVGEPKEDEPWPSSK